MEFEVFFRYDLLCSSQLSPQIKAQKQKWRGSRRYVTEETGNEDVLPAQLLLGYSDDGSSEKREFTCRNQTGVPKMGPGRSV